MTGVAMGRGGEFDLVRAFVAAWGARSRGIGGDCAELRLPAGAVLCASTDACVEDVHFREAWLSPAEIGHRAAAAALSDLAAAAAEPVGLLLALALPARWRDRAIALAEGVGEAAAAAGCPIVGGDTTAGERLMLTVTVLGAAATPLRRDGARPGDALWVTGRLGGPRLALAAFERGERPAAAWRERFARPVARVREAQWLAARGVRAAIDLSDGIAGDARHLAAASGARLVVEVDRLPLLEGAAATDAVLGGEEYELLVAGPASLDAGAFEREFGIALTRVGRVEQGMPEATGERDGRRVDLGAGHDHLSA